MENRLITSIITALALLASCNNYAPLAQKKINYKRIYSNWSYDSLQNLYILSDYPSGVRKMYPDIAETSYRKDSNIAVVRGKLLYPTLSNSEVLPLKNAPILYAIMKGKKKLILHKKLLIGSTDESGNFSITIPNPARRFFILFSKDSVLPAAVEFNIKM